MWYIEHAMLLLFKLTKIRILIFKFQLNLMIRNNNLIKFDTQSIHFPSLLWVLVYHMWDIKDNEIFFI